MQPMVGCEDLGQEESFLAFRQLDEGLRAKVQMKELKRPRDPDTKNRNPGHPAPHTPDELRG
jgi:hypothetical protein